MTTRYKKAARSIFAPLATFRNTRPTLAARSLRPNAPAVPYIGVNDTPFCTHITGALA